MVKPRGVDARVSRLRDIRKEEPLPAHVNELRRALGDRANLVVATAAEIVALRGLVELEPDLAASFDRLMAEPAESDKLCLAKIALVEALNNLASERADIFLRGIRHVQLEPRFEGVDDVAATLRGYCAFGLVRLNYRDVAVLLAELLADTEFVARVAAARALGLLQGPTVVPLLRYKASIGDVKPAVTAECLAALMFAAPQESLSFVAQFLSSGEEAVQEGAAFALGESRRPDALAVLIEHWPQARRTPLQDVFLLSISTTRLPRAFDFLLDILEIESCAAATMSALAVHRHDASLRERVAQAVESDGTATLREQFRKQFGRNAGPA